MIRRPPRSTQSRSSAASDVYKKTGDNKLARAAFCNALWRGSRIKIQQIKPIATVQDINKSMPHEPADQLHEARYRKLIEIAAQGIWRARVDGYVTYCNQWWLDYTGLDMGALEGNGWTQAVHPDHRQPALNAWLTSVATGADYEIEIPVRRASDGLYRWHLITGSPIRNDNAQIIEWIGVATDIHDRRQTTGAVSQTEAHLRLVLESMPQKIFTANAQGEVDYFCLLYTSDAADDLLCVDLGGRRIIKKKKKK